jgi:predicted metal-dependent hydrolase
VNERRPHAITSTKRLPEEGRPEAYRAFFEYFNHQRFFEAHTALEKLWLAKRGLPDADFFKGLIQLAGAFVHIQRRKRGPAMSLFRLADTTLHNYPGHHLRLDLSHTRELIQAWLKKLESNADLANSLASLPPPRLDRDLAT